MAAKRKILVVDDEEGVCELIADEIEEFGYTPFVAENGKQALDVILKQKIDLVVTDIKMPVMDGIELLRELKNDDFLRPIILITGFLDRNISVQGLRLGAFNLLEKPIKMSDLENSINDAIEYVERQDEVLGILEKSGILKEMKLKDRNIFVGLMANRTKKVA